MNRNPRLPTVDEVRQDHERLDTVSLEGDLETPVAFWSNIPWDFRTPWDQPIRHVAPARSLAWLSGLLRRWKLGPLAALVVLLDTILRGARLWRASRDPRSVVLLNLGDSSAFWFGLFRCVWRTRGAAVASHIYLHPWSAWKRALIRLSLRSVSTVAVWSHYQARNARQLLGTTGPVFLKIPYKANHSQQPREADLPVGNYLFSGGNTERDYRTLFAAVEGLPIPVIVSCTDASVLRGLIVPANVIVVAAREPHFRRLMAGARLFVMCIKPGLLRGAGEATFLNAMWHGRPVVVADDGSAAEYIDDGVNGFVVAAEDVTGLRRRILSLWDNEELCERIGDCARQTVAAEYTGRRWRERMIKLALVVLNDQRLLPGISARETTEPINETPDEERHTPVTAATTSHSVSA
jgi:hypothetical protein